MAPIIDKVLALRGWQHQFLAIETTTNQSALDGAKGEIVMYQPDETIRLEVRMEDEINSENAGVHNINRQLSALLHVWGHGLIYM